MRKILFIVAITTILASCGSYQSGELTGVQNRTSYYSGHPYGMVIVPTGSYTMGLNDQDIPWALTSQAKRVSVQAFWIDETEVTNNEYRQFVFWVRDSMAYKLLGESLEDYLITEDAYGEELSEPLINWDIPIDWKDEEAVEILQELYLPEHERFWRKKTIDTRKLVYEYFWVDYRQAAQKFTYDNQARRHYNYETQQYDGEIFNEEGEKVQIQDRSSFIMRGQIAVYPDTLCWISDFTYSYNEPMTNMYFWHPSYDNYPVVGINWEQARAFGIWRTSVMNANMIKAGQANVQDYRLPMESEWEYAARGGLDISMYPWGGYYTRNNSGCFLANFKPLRGDYVDDGGLNTVEVAVYDPNEYGIYDMAGNVAEWTNNSFDESAYSFTHDMNPDYSYLALPDDPPVLKRKVIRGGSWKDIGHYMQVGSRSYEYQDTSKSYIGFRNVRTYMGTEYSIAGRSKVY